MFKGVSLKTKLVLAPGISFAILGIIVICLVFFQVTNFNTNMMEKIISLSDTVIETDVSGIENQVQAITKDLANVQRLKVAVQARDVTAISNISTQFVDLANNPDFFVIITDQSGKVIYTTLDKSYIGTDLSTQNPVKSALSGKSAAGIETAKLVRLSIRAYAPLYGDNGQIIGTVNVGKKISDSTIFAEQLSKDTGSFVSFYLGDERVATTMPGEQIGTKQDNQKIVEAVLKSGTSPIVRIERGGTHYIERFTPIKDTAGNIIGMRSVAVPTTEYDNYFKAIVFSLIGAIVFVCIVLLVLFTVFINKAIAKPIESLAKGIEELSKGDFTLQLPKMNEDELGRIRSASETLRVYLVGILQKIKSIQDQINQSIEEMLSSSTTSKTAAGESKKASENMADAASNLSKSAQEISNQVSQLLSAIDAIAKGSEDLAKSASRLSEKTSEIADKSEQIEEGAKAVDELAKHVDRDAQNGAQIIQETQSTMDSIVKSVENLSGVMNNLKDRSLEIGKIVDVISNIAEQTNLLALNAAIEAARAGDAGRGFAVVADEVRKLAEESQKAAVEIGKMITETIRETDNAVKSMDETKEGVLKGSSMSARTSDAFKNILSAIEKLSARIDQTSANIINITRGVQEIESEVSNLAALSEENSAASEEMAAAAKEISTNVENIAATSEEMAAASEEVAASSQESETMAIQIDTEAKKLAERTKELKEEIGKYKF